MSEYDWKEVKKYLDDPYVSADTKQALLYEYYQQRHLGSLADPNSGLPKELNPEAVEYYEKYKTWEGDNADRGFESSRTALEQAKTESSQQGNWADQKQKRLEENKPKIDETTSPFGSSGGAENSNDLLEPAKHGLDPFHKFVPIDQGVPGHLKHIDGPLDYAKDIRERYWQQGNIDFKAFVDERTRLDNLYDELTALRDRVKENLNSLYRDWTGEAANASYQNYSEEIEPKFNDLIEHIDGLRPVLERSMNSIFEQVKSKAQDVVNMYTPTVGQAVPDMARKVISLAGAESLNADDKERILDVAAWVDSVCGSNLESTINSDNTCMWAELNEENVQLVIEECGKWVTNSWNVDLYDNLHSNFDSLCSDTKEAVDGYYQEINDYLSEFENEFKGKGKNGPGQGQGQGGGDIPTPGPNVDAGAGTPNISGSQVPTPGPSVGSGGDSPGGGASAPPPPEVETPKPEDLKVDAPGGDGAADAGGGESGTGQDGGSGPGAEDLRGGPGRNGDAADRLVGEHGVAERDTLTVEQGDKKLELAEPNADGEMAISVDDGNGQLKDYKLDFGNGEDASGGAQPGGPTEGGPAEAAGQNQGPGGEGQGPGAGQGQNPGEQGRQDFGPQGSGGGQGAGQGEKVYTPDEDGKIRIQDGDTEIVAEQPDGPDGPTTVTVDDGKGEPTTYTLGEEQSEPSAAGGGGMRPGGGGAEFAGRGMSGEPVDVAGQADAAQADAADGGVAQAAQDGGPQAASDVGAADAGSVTGDLGAAGGGTPAEPSGDAMQAASAASGGPSMPDDMGSAGGGAPESGGGTPAADSSPAGQAGGDQAPAADADDSGGTDDSTSPASSLGSSLGDDALGGGAGEDGGGSLGDAGMGESADGGPAADSGDGDNGGPGGSGDRGGGSGAAGSGMMGGGMGGAGGGGGGGDEERQSQFILNAVSDLFGEAVAGNHITGTIGEGVEPAVSFSR